MNTSELWIVAGSGFRGIIGAYLLASKGKEVVLIERDKILGGVLNSVPWKGFYLDKGCHLFDNDDDLTTSIVLDILGNDIEPVHVRYASVMNRVKTDGFAIPNLGSFGKDVARNILYELINAATKSKPECDNLQERLDRRFGLTAGRYLAKAASKMYQTEISHFEAESLWMTPFGRLKFLDDVAADILKQSPVLDDLIASSSQVDPMRFYRNKAKNYPHRNFYPKYHGLRRFGERAEERLAKMGVSLRFGQGIRDLHINGRDLTITLSSGEQIQGQYLLWTLGAEFLGKLLEVGTLKKYVHQVPMVIYYFVIEKSQQGHYTYLQNFDPEDMFFRASVPGGYITNSACPEGMSYVCCEVPTTIDSAEWKNPSKFVSRIWTELQNYGIVNHGNPVEVLPVKVPATYKMPKVGYKQALTQMKDKLGHEARIVGIDDWDFSKNDIIRSLYKILEV